MDAVTFKPGDIVEVRQHPLTMWAAGLRFRVTDIDGDLVNGVRVKNPRDPRYDINGIQVGDEVGFFTPRLVKVGPSGFGVWYRGHAS